MSDAIAKIRRDLHEEAQAAKALLGSLSHLISDDEQAASDAVEGETNLHEAIARAVSRLAELEKMSEALLHMKADIVDRETRFKTQHERIRTAIGMAMEAAGMKKLELPLATVSLKAVPPKVEVTDEASIPSIFFKQAEPTLDKRAILAALKDKREVPGAMLSNGSLTISVRMS